MTQIYCLELAQELVERLTKKKQTITFVESCTGGALAHFLTSVPGSGKVFHQSFVTYSEEGKMKLGVKKSTLEKYGVYSREIAVEMAQAGLNQASQADYSVGVTGVLDASESTVKRSHGDIHVAVLSQDQALSYQHYEGKPSVEKRLELKIEFLSDIFEQILRFVL